MIQKVWVVEGCLDNGHVSWLVASYLDEKIALEHARLANGVVNDWVNNKHRVQGVISSYDRSRRLHWGLTPNYIVRGVELYLGVADYHLTEKV